MFEDERLVYILMVVSDEPGVVMMYGEGRLPFDRWCLSDGKY